MINYPPDRLMLDEIIVSDGDNYPGTDRPYRLENWSKEDLEMYCGIYQEDE